MGRKIDRAIKNLSATYNIPESTLRDLLQTCQTDKHGRQLETTAVIKRLRYEASALAEERKGDEDG